MITVKLLKNIDLILDASALLYQVYIEEHQWKFVVDNPLSLRIEIKNGRKVLLDRFTDNALWFGAFDDKILIGCMRLTSADVDKMFELESSPGSEIVQKYLPKADTGVELSKIAIQRKYAGHVVIKRMWLAAFNYCQANNLSIICCTHNGYFKYIFKRIGFPLIVEQAFKYEPLDPSLVNLYVADYLQDVPRMVSALECLDGDLSPNSSKIFKALELVAQILPVSTYWHDTDRVVLGVNEHCLNMIGSSYQNIVGKSPYEFYPEHTAEHIVSHNSQVIRNGEIMTQEEWIEDITTGAKKCFSSTKAPLYDDEGKIIGVIGSFVEITAQKEAERLKLENIKLEAQNKLNKAIFEKDAASAETERLRLENELQKFENEAHIAEKKSQEKITKFINKMLHEIQSFRIDEIHEKIGFKSQITATNWQIKLTKREQQILYFLSLNKSPKEIAKIITIIEGKVVSDSTINAIINKKLYPKFEVFNVGQLVEKAIMLNLIPFLLDNFSS